MGIDIEKLKRDRLALLDSARELVDTAEKEGRDLTAEERESYEARVKDADSIEARITREQELDKRHGVFVGGGPKTGRPMPDPHIGMGEGDRNKYSIARALRAAATGDWSGATLEQEASNAVAKLVGYAPRGFFVPFDVMQGSPEARERRQAWFERRDLTKGTPADGGYTIGTDMSGFIDRLINRMVCAQAGVTFLNGLVGDVAVPRLATGVTAYWVAENAAPTEGTQAFEQITLTPKTVAGYVDISRRLIQQSSIDVENLVQNDLARSLALALDLAILVGTGASNQPTGVRYQTGVTDKSGTNGDVMVPGTVGTLTGDNQFAMLRMILLESTVATANADVGRLAFITNSTMRGVLKGCQGGGSLTAPAGPFVWGDNNQVIGYPAFATNQLVNTLTKAAGTALSYVFFGNWADVLVGSWGSLDILVDPYTGSSAGTVRVVAFNETDIAVRHAASFAYLYAK